MFNFLRRNKGHKSKPSDQLELFNLRSGQLIKVYRRSVYAKTAVMVLIASSVIWSQDLLNSAVPDEYIQILEIDGTIQGGSHGMGYDFSHRFLDATENDSAKGIFIRVNSGGGSPMQSEIIFNTIETYTQQPLENRKPVYVSIQDTCASACLHAVAPADHIAAHRSSVVGSIGVIFSSWDASELLDKIGVERKALHLGEHKAMLDPFLEGSEKQDALLTEALLTPMYEGFVADMQRARGNKLNDIDGNLYSGLAWAGEKAKERGLVDAIETTIETEKALENKLGISDYQMDVSPGFSFSRLFSAAISHFQLN